MRLMPTLLFLIGISGSILPFLPLSVEWPVSWLANAASISPLPGIYSGDGQREDYRTRFEIIFGKPGEPEARWVIQASELRKWNLSVLGLRSWVTPLQAFALESEEPAQMSRWVEEACSLRDIQKRLGLKRPATRIRLLAIDAADNTIVRDQEYECSLR